MSEKFRGEMPPQERGKISEYSEAIKKALENRRLVREQIESVGEEKIKLRMEEIGEGVKARGLKLSREELRRLAVFSYAPQSELLPNGWVSERLDKSFGSSLASDTKVTFVDPKSLIFRNEGGDWHSQLESEKAYVFKEETPRLTERRGWQEEQGGAEKNLDEEYDFFNTEDLTDEQLKEFVHPDAIAIKLVSEEEIRS